MTEETKVQGIFQNSLKMNGKEVRDNRARQLALGAEMAYRSKVDGYLFELNTLIMEQENSLDLSPDNAFSFIKLSDFKPEIFAEKDTKMAFDIRNTAIKFLTAVNRYEELFGEKYNIKEDERLRIEQLAKI